MTLSPAARKRRAARRRGCAKHGFYGRHAALDGLLRALGAGAKVRRVYRCDRCGSFHLTSKRWVVRWTDYEPMRGFLPMLTMPGHE